MGMNGKLLPLASLLGPVLRMVIPFLPSLMCLNWQGLVQCLEPCKHSNDGKECIIKMYLQKYIDGCKQISEVDFKSTAKSSVEHKVST
jgi:hypothetical protein